jgi:hypothetical protein
MDYTLQQQLTYDVRSTADTVVADTQRLLDTLLRGYTSHDTPASTPVEAVTIDLDTNQDTLGDAAPIVRIYHPRVTPQTSLVAHITSSNLHRVVQRYGVQLAHTFYHTLIAIDTYVGTYLEKLQRRAPLYTHAPEAHVSEQPTTLVAAHVPKRAPAPANLPCEDTMRTPTTNPTAQTPELFSTNQANTYDLAMQTIRRVYLILRYGHSIDSK